MDKADVVVAYKRTGSIKSTVAATGLSHQTVLRIEKCRKKKAQNANKPAP